MTYALNRSIHRLLICAVLGASAYACNAHDRPKPMPRASSMLETECLAVQAGAEGSELAAAQAKVKAARNEPSAWVNVGHSFVRRARSLGRPELYVNADSCAEHALSIKPGDPNALHLRGMVLLIDHRFRDAQALAQGLLARDPDDVFAWSVLSDASLELGAMDVAVGAAQHMLDLKPDLLSYGRAAHLRFLQGDVQGATMLYREAIAAGRLYKDREPSAWMITQAALVFLSTGDYAGAEAGLQLALREVPNYAPALQGMERVALARSGRADGPLAVTSSTER